MLGDHREHVSEVIDFTDSDWASDERDSKSRAAFMFKLAGGAISWSSKKLPSIATSSTVAEYKALLEGA